MIVKSLMLIKSKSNLKLTKQNGYHLKVNNFTLTFSPPGPGAP